MRRVVSAIFGVGRFKGWLGRKVFGFPGFSDRCGVVLRRGLGCLGCDDFDILRFGGLRMPCFLLWHK